MQIMRIDGQSTGQHSAEIIGAKASNLARMAALGLPVPPAFVLPIELCAGIVLNDAEARQTLIDGLADGVGFLEKATAKRLGDQRRPLLVSVRSSAAQSMPGMLDTVLNVGCTSAAVHGLVRMTGNPRPRLGLPTSLPGKLRHRSPWRRLRHCWRDAAEDC